MKFNYYEVTGNLPVVVIDDFYDNEAADRIWKEITFYSSRNKFFGPEETGSAYQYDDNNNKIYIKQNKGVFIDDIYKMRNISDILTENRKVFYPEVTDKLVDLHPIFRYLKISNADSTLLSYYEDSDYYLPHTDDCTLTAVSWFYKRPKQFSGGSLTIEKNLKIDCEYNRTVIFPSILYHEVEPISIDDSLKNKNMGRYTITQLISYKM